MRREPRVLFATDFHGDVKGGLHLATRLAAERAATLVILHVVPLDAQAGEGMLHQSVSARRARPERALQSLVPDDPAVPFLHALEQGDPLETIAAFVARERVDLLVMEVRQRPALARALGGRGLVRRLLERLECPVVTYRAGGVALEAAAAAAPSAPVVPAEVLPALLNARVEALVSWLALRREAARRVSASASLRDGAAALFRATRHATGGVFAPRLRRLLELELTEHQRAQGALGVSLVACGEALVQLGVGARADAALARFSEQLERQGSAASLPLEPAEAQWDLGLVILAGARLELPGLEAAHLVFTFDARRDFLRILAQPGPAPSAETYAFDAEGVMLSNSRFPDQLQRAGLLPRDPGAQTPRRIRVCDPAGDGPGAARPLTRMAADATAGHDGADFTGYRDYRGVQVVGAWRWLAEHGFGVAVEMDWPSPSEKKEDSEPVP
ncbi:MAG: hypothetical protein AMXMBFR34_21990 [Myxococcaceae bacterium]